jgi:hypothetical protein
MRVIAITSTEAIYCVKCFTIRARRKARGSFATISVVWPYFTASSSLIREPITDGYAGSSGATTPSAEDVRTKV